MHGGWGDAAGGPGDQPGRSLRPAFAEPAEESAVLAALQQIQELADLVAASSLWPLSNEQSVAALRESAVAVRKVQAAHLTVLADMDGRRGTLPNGVAGYEGRSYLKHRLNRTTGQAKADLAAAHALGADADPAGGGLPRLGAAFRDGEVSREHVDAALRIVGRFPKALLALPMHSEDGTLLLDEHGNPMCAGDVIDERITEYARTYTSRALTQLALHLQDAIDPDGRFDPESCIRRGLRLHWDHQGMLVLRGELDPAAGALFMAVIDHLARPRRHHPEDEGDNVPDERTTGQRQADALLEVVRAAQSSGNLGERGGEPARVTLITRPEDLAAAQAAAAQAAASAEPAARTEAGDGAELGTGTHIGPRLLARFACDAVIQRVLLAPSGAILDLGRDVRTVTPAQRRALHARDRGCVIPGCDVPAAWTEGHHVRWWSDGGPTDIANLALLCARHHTEVHAGTWLLYMDDDGLPWAIPPDWIDPRRKPQRNRLHQDAQAIRDLGRQLRHVRVRKDSCPGTEHGQHRQPRQPRVDDDVGDGSSG